MLNRQNNTPVQFNRTTRRDQGVGMTSIRAGLVNPITYAQLLRGDSAAGQVQVALQLAEMPKPLENSVTANIQAWFVPKSANPKFSGYDEFMHSYNGDPIKTLGAADRTPPAFFDTLTGADLTTFFATDFAKKLGLHPTGDDINTDLIDAFVLLYNFRLAAHSTKLTRKEYAKENLSNSTALPRAFWPTGHFSHIVPDYERALVVGSLDLDVTAGQIPISGIGYMGAAVSEGTFNKKLSDKTTDGAAGRWATMDGPNKFVGKMDANAFPEIFAEMSGQTVGITLADIDKARQTQAFAKLRAAYAGNDATGFDNDDTILADLMQGFRVPDEMFKRPWLLDSQRVTFGMQERHATDAANLEDSVTLGQASATLSCNVPVQDTGGYIMVTCEIVPERLDERQQDPGIFVTTVEELPNALRDIQRPEPVDPVPNKRIDSRHSTPNGVYGYEPMNAKWDRTFTRLGGEFYQADPSNPFTEARTGIWQTSLVDPAFTADHWLCPDPFPHNVFADTTGDCAQVVFRQNLRISGLTQIGDVLQEDNGEYTTTETAT